MRRFYKSIPGKVVLYVLFVVVLGITGISAGAAALLIESDYWTLNEKEALINVRENNLHDEVWNLIINRVRYDGNNETDLALKILDENNKEVYKSETYDAGSKDDNNVLFTFNAAICTPKNNAPGEEGYRDYYWVDLNFVGNKNDCGPDSKIEVFKVMVYTDPTVPMNYQDSIVISIAKAAIAAKSWMVPIVIIGIIICLAIFVALICGAGRKPDTDELVPGPLFIIPYDVLSAAAIACLVGWVLICDEFDSTKFVLVIILFSLPGLVFGFLGLCTSFASRVKQHRLFKELLIYRVLKLAWKLIKKICRIFVDAIKLLPMFWKVAAAICVIAFIEGIFIGNLSRPSDEFVLLFIAEKLLIIVGTLFLCQKLKTIKLAGEKLAAGNLQEKIDTKGMYFDIKDHAENLNSISDGMSAAVNQKIKSERMKTELITNVSHDLKTPITSIINYAGLIANEPCENAKINEYSKVLVRQSDKLKRLIEDLVEASKASTGNIDVNLVPCEASVFVSQAGGEYFEKLEAAGLSLVNSVHENDIYIMADNRRMWRVFDNIMNNICKYSQNGTRVYISLEKEEGKAIFTFKNTSREPLNISADELMERFVRGDSSRNTEGNGLGLSIARSLTEIQGGNFEIQIDGDLFKTKLAFPIIN